VVLFCVQALRDECLRGAKYLSRLLEDLGLGLLCCTTKHACVYVHVLQALHDECLRGAKYLSRLLEALGFLLVLCVDLLNVCLSLFCMQALHNECLRGAKYLSRLLEAVPASVCAVCTSYVFKDWTVANALILCAGAARRVPAWRQVPVASAGGCACLCLRCVHILCFD
jgi:hypothetical protein